MAVAKPLNIDTFTASLRALGITPDMRLAVAVSGGVDSVTLAHLAWHSHAQGNLIFLTVDHRLRETSTREAHSVAQTICAWGGVCDILTWDAAAGGSGVQERARKARYGLLRDAAHRHGCAAVLLGHNGDDQTETFWMRLADGSGLSGLGGMQVRREHDGMAWLRPLLDMPRADIAAYARQHELPVIEDPSNTNGNFTRVRLRGFAQQLAQEGLDAPRLTRTMGKLRAADDALQAMTQDFMRQHLRVHSGGALHFSHAAFAGLPPDLRRRVVQTSVMAMTPRDYPPAYDALVALAQSLARDDAVAGSLGGCLFALSRGDIWVMREPASARVLRLDDVQGDALFWDHRFELGGIAKLAGQGIALSALGEAGIAALGQEKERLLWTEDFKNAPATIKRGVAALWRGQKLLAVPQFSWRAGGFDLPLPDIRPHISFGDIV